MPKLKDLGILLLPVVVIKPVFDHLFPLNPLIYQRAVSAYMLGLFLIGVIYWITDERKRRRFGHQWKRNSDRLLRKLLWFTASWIRRQFMVFNIWICLVFTLVITVFVEVLLYNETGRVLLKIPQLSYFSGLTFVCLVAMVCIDRIRQPGRYDGRGYDPASSAQYHCGAAFLKEVRIGPGRTADDEIMDIVLKSKGELRILSINAHFLLGTPGLIKEYVAVKDNSVRALLHDPINIHVKRRGLRLGGDFERDYVGTFYDIANTMDRISTNIAALTLQVRFTNEIPRFRLFLLPSICLVQFYEPFTRCRESKLYATARHTIVANAYELVSTVQEASKAKETMYDFFAMEFEKLWANPRTSTIRTLQNEASERVRSLYSFLIGSSKGQSEDELLKAIHAKVFPTTDYRAIELWRTNETEFRKILESVSKRCGSAIRWIHNDSACIHTDYMEIKISFHAEAGSIRAESDIHGYEAYLFYEKLCALLDTEFTL